jgi:hypothetical protein
MVAKPFACGAPDADRVREGRVYKWSIREKKGVLF